MLYAFVLGRKNLLSTAELCSVLDKDQRIIDIQRETLIANFDKPLAQPQDSLNRLGGTIKIAAVFAELPLTGANENIASTTSEYLIAKFKDHPSKLPYGLSVYSFSQRHEGILKKSLINIKKNLKKVGINSRFINKNFKNLANAAITGEKLIEKGAEIIIIQGAHKIFIAETKAIQDFENYSHRDYDRPSRDPRLGMLPPKLAQIMINLGGYTKLESPPKKDTTIYDPFTGTGTILTEGLLLEYSVVGSDINQDVLDGAQKNIDWIKENYKITQSARLFQKDATSLTKKDLPEEINVIATESFLGPPQTQLPNPEQIKKNFNHIEETLTRFFHSIHNCLKPSTPIIISMAAYRGKHRVFTMEKLPDAINKLGYKIEPLISHEIQTKFSLSMPESDSLLYDRPNQIVGREIWRFMRL